MTPDAELLRRYLDSGSETAFAELVRRHVNFVYSAALRMTRSAQLAEDVAQKVFTELCRKAKGLSGRQNLVGWLYITTRYAAAGMIRSENRRTRREEAAALLGQDTSRVDVEISWNRLAPVLDRVLGKLGAADRELVLLRFFENASYGDIGTALSLSENAARMRLVRALQKLRKYLAREGIASTTTALELAFGGQITTAAPAAWVGTLPAAAMAASNAVGVTAFGGLAAIMTTKFTFAIAGLAVLVGSAVTLRREIIRDRAAIAVSELDIVQLQQRLAESSQSRDAFANSAAGPKGARSQRPDRQPTQANAFFLKLSASPAYEAASLASYRSILGLRYGKLYRDRHFTPGQIRQFEDAMVRRAQSDFDLFAAAYTLGIPASDPAVETGRAKSLADMTQSLAGLATPDDLTRYENAESGRGIANQLAASLANTDTPLSLSQKATLADLIAQNRGDDDINWDAIMAKAADQLSPSQLSMLSAIQADITSGGNRSRTLRNAIIYGDNGSK